VSLDLSPDPQRVMAALISVRPDDSVQATLVAEARTRGIDLATFLRQLATEAARELRRNAIQAKARPWRAIWPRTPRHRISPTSGARPARRVCKWRLSPRVTSSSPAGAAARCRKNPTSSAPLLLSRTRGCSGRTNVIVVALTEDAGLAIPGLMEPIEPGPYALVPFVTSTSAQRLRATRSRIRARAATPSTLPSRHPGQAKETLTGDEYLALAGHRHVARIPRPRRPDAARSRLADQSHRPRQQSTEHQRGPA
jgi:hypothetical protein